MVKWFSPSCIHVYWYINIAGALLIQDGCFVNSYLENERSQTILPSNCLSLLSIVYAPVGLFKHICGFDLYINSKT